MTPSDPRAAALRRIASRIDASKSPSRSLVARDLRRALAALGSGESDAAVWDLKTGGWSDRLTADPADPVGSVSSMYDLDLHGPGRELTDLRLMKDLERLSDEPCPIRPSRLIVVDENDDGPLTVVAVG